MTLAFALGLPARVAALAIMVSPQAEPTVVPFTVPTTEIALKAMVDGRERTLVLSTSSPASYLRDAPAESVSVRLTDASLGNVRFIDVGDDIIKPFGGDGALGALALSGMAIGVNLSDRTLALWPHGGLAPTVAETWVGASGAKVRRVPLTRLPGGAYAVEATLGGSRSLFLLRLGLYSSSLEPRSKLPVVPVGDDGFALAPDLALDGRAVGPLVYLPTPEGTIDRTYIGTPGTLTLDALASSRVLVDFAAGNLYVEDLPDDVRLSQFLTRQTRIPLTVEGERILLSPPPGSPGVRALSPYYGNPVIEMAGKPTTDWLASLRGQDGESTQRLAELIGKTRQGFGLVIRKPDGTELPLNIRLPKQ